MNPKEEKILGGEECMQMHKTVAGLGDQERRTPVDWNTPLETSRDLL